MTNEKDIRAAKKKLTTAYAAWITANMEYNLALSNMKAEIGLIWKRKK